jgi:hypothetical protein
MTWIARYHAAHKEHFRRSYPSAYASGHYTPPMIPRVTKANGMTLAIVNFINWSGYNATRISSAGRLVGDAVTVTESGTRLRTQKFIPGPTRKGTADITATIKGRSVKIEVKVGKDRPSQEQLKEQARERAAGGIYEFIADMGEFFALYDQVNNLK